MNAPQIIRPDWKSLWQSEYPVVVERLLDIAQKHDVEALRLTRRFTNANNFRPQLKLMVAQSLASKFSIKTTNIDNDRDTDFTVIYGVAKSFAKALQPALRQAGEQVMALIDKHGSDIPRANYTSETQRLRGFYEEAEANAETMAAINAMALGPVFTSLKANNDLFEQVFAQRADDMASKPNIDLHAIRIDCTAAMNELFDGIEYAAKETPSDDCAALIAEINERTSYIRAQLKARAARRKAGVKVDEEPPISVEN